MKKPFFHKRNTLIRFRIFSFSTSLLALGVLLIIFRVTMPGLFLEATAPLLSIGTSLTTGISNVTNSFADTRALTHEKTQLLMQNNILLRENKTLTARVQDMTALIGTSTPRVRGIVANVLARPPQSPYDTLLINTSASSRITPGDYVLAQGGTPIGTIGTVYAHTAYVVLFSTPNATTTAWVGTKRIPITLIGTGAGTFAARVVRQAGVSIGDSILVSGPGSVHAIGTVVRLDTRPVATMTTLRIRPLVNIFSLTTVEVVPR